MKWILVVVWMANPIPGVKVSGEMRGQFDSAAACAATALAWTIQIANDYKFTSISCVMEESK
jgi:hypothetical protein